MMKLAGAIEVVVRPHRGLDLGAASFAGQPFAWLTPLGEDAPTVAGDWWASWGGGLMTTAGLDNIASPPTGFRSTGRTQGNVDIDSEAVEPRDAASAAGDWLRLRREAAVPAARRSARVIPRHHGCATRHT